MVPISMLTAPLSSVLSGATTMPAPPSMSMMPLFWNCPSPLGLATVLVAPCSGPCLMPPGLGSSTPSASSVLAPLTEIVPVKSVIPSVANAASVPGVVVSMVKSDSVLLSV